MLTSQESSDLLSAVPFFLTAQRKSRCQPTFRKVRKELRSLINYNHRLTIDMRVEGQKINNNVLCESLEYLKFTKRGLFVHFMFICKLFVTHPLCQNNL